MQNYPIEIKVYASIIEHCKSLEGKVVDNGSILAKKLASTIAISLLSTQQKKIYDCLTEKPKETKTISQETKISKIQVINQLRQINKMTQLISFGVEGRNKLWSKT
jgi:hypothetical protein